MEINISKVNTIEISTLMNTNNEAFITREEYNEIFEQREAALNNNISINEFKDNILQRQSTTLSLDTYLNCPEMEDTRAEKWKADYGSGERNISRMSTNIDKQSKFNKIVLNDTLNRKKRKRAIKENTCKCLIF
jgi:oligoendopeptidase F